MLCSFWLLLAFRFHRDEDCKVKGLTSLEEFHINQDQSRWGPCWPLLELQKKKKKMKRKKRKPGALRLAPVSPTLARRRPAPPLPLHHPQPSLHPLRMRPDRSRSGLAPLREENEK